MVHRSTTQSSEPAGAFSDRRRLRWSRIALLVVALSYLVDAVFLAAYYALGIVSWWVPGVVALVGLSQCIVFDAITRSKWAGGRSDRGLTFEQTLVGAVAQLIFIVLVPQGFLIFAFATVTLIAFGTLQLSFRRTLAVWAVMTMAIVSLALLGVHFEVPTASPSEQALLIAMWSLVILRCSLIGGFGLAIRQTVLRSHQRVAATAQAFEQIAQRDPLTNVSNRRRILELMETARGSAKAEGSSYAIAMIDLDHFKAVNDLHGQLAGDAVLKVASTCIASALRTSDEMGRYGGEEFIVLLNGIGDEFYARRAGERFRLAIADQPWGLVVPELQQTASVGVAVHRFGDTVAMLIARADQALYASKRGGGNRVSVG